MEKPSPLQHVCPHVHQHILLHLARAALQDLKAVASALPVPSLQKQSSGLPKRLAEACCKGTSPLPGAGWAWCPPHSLYHLYQELDCSCPAPRFPPLSPLLGPEPSSGVLQQAPGEDVDPPQEACMTLCLALILLLHF